eukprot:6472521-Amphidinium_carterae.1
MLGLDCDEGGTYTSEIEASKARLSPIGYEAQRNTLNHVPTTLKHTWQLTCLRFIPCLNQTRCGSAGVIMLAAMVCMLKGQPMCSFR